MVLHEAIIAHRDAEQAVNLARFFKTGVGEYGEGDRFLGVKVPVTREVVKALWRECTFAELEECLASEWHEVRLAALLVLVQQFQHARKHPEKQKACIDFYLAHLDSVNNWDLVDLSCYELLGSWLLDKDATLLYDLARDGKTVWQQRIGIVSTMQFLRHDRLDDTYAIADILLHHPHDLIHKAVGWLLREAGKRDEGRLHTYLATRYQTMPRTMLRYAIEKFPPEIRKGYLSKEPKRHIEVVAAIIVDGGKVFATQRGKGDWRGWWEFPGGKMEVGEKPEEALKREIREELEVEISVDRYVETVDWEYPKFHLTMHCYRCHLVAGQPKLTEHLAAQWLAPAELLTLKWLPADRDLVGRLVSEL